MGGSEPFCRGRATRRPVRLRRSEGEVSRLPGKAARRLFGLRRGAVDEGMHSKHATWIATGGDKPRALQEGARSV